MQVLLGIGHLLVAMVLLAALAGAAVSALFLCCVRWFDKASREAERLADEALRGVEPPTKTRERLVDGIAGVHYTGAFEQTADTDSPLR